MNRDKVVILDSKEVVDIKNLSTSDLYDLRKKLDERVVKVTNNIRLHDSKMGYVYCIVFFVVLHSIVTIVMEKNGFLDTVKNLAIVEGTTISLPIIYDKVRSYFLSKKREKACMDYKKVSEELTNRLIKEECEGKRKRVEDSLEKLKIQIIKGVELNSYEQSLKEYYIGYLIRNNASEEIINMPAIQRLLDLSIHNDYDDRLSHRSFKYNKVNEDGTFTISSYIKYPAGCLAPRMEEEYVISYCNDGDSEHYIMVTNNSKQVIYINRDGKIVSIENSIWINSNLEIISIPLEEQSKLVHTI